MKFTSTELRSIERTVDKFRDMGRAAWSSEQADAVNARYLSHIIAEVRLCADLMASDDRTVRLAAADRLVAIITN